MKFCVNCGSSLKPDVKFCDNCGQPVEHVRPVVESPPIEEPYTPVVEEPIVHQHIDHEVVYEPVEDGPTYTEAPIYTENPEPRPSIPKGKRKLPIVPIAIGLVVLIILSSFLKKGKKGDVADKPPKGGSGNLISEDAGSKFDKWQGSWFGYIWVTEADGTWSEAENILMTAYMAIDLDKNGKGTMAIFLADESEQAIDAYVLADEHHVEVTEGEFWDYELSPSDWWFGISPVDKGNLVVITDTYFDPEGTSDDWFEYMFVFRPWGELWEDEVANNKKLPPDYDNYVYTIEQGVGDPNKDNAGGQDSSSGGSGDLIGGSSKGQAGLIAGEFIKGTKVLSGFGVNITYQENLATRTSSMGYPTVDINDTYSVWAQKQAASYSLEEMRDSLENLYSHYKGYKMYESTYKGHPCLVFMHDKDPDIDSDATLSLYVYPQGNGMIEITVVSYGGTLDFILTDPTTMAVVNNVDW